jgi:hypothetical protein
MHAKKWFYKAGTGRLMSDTAFFQFLREFWLCTAPSLQAGARLIYWTFELMVDAAVPIV